MGKVTRCLCDNAAVVAIVKSGRSKDDMVMHLVRKLFYFSAKHDICLSAEHIVGSCNRADSLSTNNIPLSNSQVPCAARNFMPIPAEVMQLILLQGHDWTLEIWIWLLRSISQKA